MPGQPPAGDYARTYPVLRCPAMTLPPAPWKCAYQSNEHVFNGAGRYKQFQFDALRRASGLDLFLCGNGLMYTKDKYWFRIGTFGRWHAKGATGIAFCDGHTETRRIDAIPGDPNGYMQGWNTDFINPP
jgi:prepilin-type processing-associated H-X9-DG protein